MKRQLAAGYWRIAYQVLPEKKVCKFSAQNIRAIVDAHVMVKLNCKGSVPRKAII